MVPLDVGGFQSGRRVPDAQIEATDTTAVLVGTQHPISEGRVAFAAHGLGVVQSGCCSFSQFIGAVQLQSQRGHDVHVEGGWEVGLQRS